MSRTIDILNAKTAWTEYTAEAYSISETILKAIANNTENLVNVLTATIEGGALQRFQIPLESVKGKIISASAFVQNQSTEGNGARIRIDVTNNGTVTYAMGNDILTGRNGISKSDLPVGTYIVKGKFKKTQNFNALAGMNESNERTAFGSFKDNFTEDTITFTTTEKLKYLYIDTGSATADGYCEVDSLMFGKNLPTEYVPYCFGSEIETAFYKAFGAD